jgi:hypothetical protein
MEFFHNCRTGFELSFVSRVVQGVTPIVIQDFVTAKTDNGDYQNPTDLSSNDVMQGFKAGQLSGDSLVWKGIEVVPNFRQHSQGLKTQEA